ncbi:MAG: hypothetical protein J7513_02580 [Solirubrobacteraceae bacterium]|nr:hypothetical protein [Solirubrobacteraceae bacterium]
MLALLDWIIAAFLLTCSLSALAALIVLWRSLATDWSEAPPNHHRRGRYGALIGLGWLAASAALINAEPWGDDTPLYVIGLGGMGAMVGVFLILVWQTLIDMHRARVAARERRPAGWPRMRTRAH